MLNGIWIKGIWNHNREGLFYLACIGRVYVCLGSCARKPCEKLALCNVRRGSHDGLCSATTKFLSVKD